VLAKSPRGFWCSNTKTNGDSGDSGDSGDNVEVAAEFLSPVKKWSGARAVTHGSEWRTDTDDLSRRGKKGQA
jgi:hypothetical protein